MGSFPLVRPAQNLPEEQHRGHRSRETGCLGVNLGVIAVARPTSQTKLNQLRECPITAVGEREHVLFVPSTGSTERLHLGTCETLAAIKRRSVKGD